MTSEELEELETKAYEAMSGPWAIEAGSSPVMIVSKTERFAPSVDGGPYLDAWVCNCGSAYTEEERERVCGNAEFIAAANPTTVLALLAEIKRLRQLLHELTWQEVSS